jgi:hypothetical protein
MIDTLYLDFIAPDYRGRIIYPSFIVFSRDQNPITDERIHDTDLLPYTGARLADKGRWAYIRLPERFPFTLDIRAWKNGSQHCLVKFSVPKLLGPDNWDPVGPSEFPRAMEVLQGSLWDAGLEVKFENARIARIDLFKNIVMKYDFLHYKRVLRLLNVASADTKVYQTGMAWNNPGGYWGVTAYDKSAQAEALRRKQIENTQREEVKGPKRPRRVLRVELKLLRKRAILGELGFDRIDKLCAGWGELRETYERFLRERLFQYEPDSLKVKMVDGLDDLVTRYCVSPFDERWVNKMLQDYGAYSLAKRFGKEPLLEAIAARSGLAGSSLRSKRSRLNRMFAEQEVVLGLEEAASNGLSLHDLYRELRSKLLSPS